MVYLIVADRPGARALLLESMLTMNISLAVFNLLPFPPLDGSKVLETFLPESMQPMYAGTRAVRFLILMMLMYLGVFDAIIRPILMVVYSLFLAISEEHDEANLQRRATHR